MMGLLLSAVWLMAGCSVIDDDLTDCGSDYRMDYELKLVTNLTTELQTLRTTETEFTVADALEEQLKDIFTDMAHDVDLLFYDNEGKLPLLHHDQHTMDASQKTYTIYLPVRGYRHLAIANIKDDPSVTLEDNDHCTTAVLRHTGTPADDGSIAPLTTGIFTAREDMDVLEGVDQTFNVRMYMANCGAALIIDPNGQSFRDIRVYATGFATEFHVSDSTYIFADPDPLIRTTEVATGNEKLCFLTVNFPSRPLDEENPDKSLWQFKAYVTRDDGSVTETIIDVREPLQAGEFKIIKCKLDDDCAVRPHDSTVGVSVTLDWNSAGEYNPEL